MTTRHRPRQRPTSRRAVPISDADAAQLRDCCCSRLPGTHQAGHCADPAAVSPAGG
jgi:hypothetical protein